MTMPLFASTSTVKILTIAAFGIAVAMTTYALTSTETFASRLYRRYVAHLNGIFRVLFQPERGRLIADVQLVSLVSAFLLRVYVVFNFSWIAALLIALGPELYLRLERHKRIALLEQQIDGFILAFANSLKTVPSPAAALQATAMTLQQPTRQEIEHVLKEMRVGSTLEQALIAMSSRIKSAWLDTAFSAVLIGLRVGGNLPIVLERTAGTIREMNRLLGVVRTKTGEGRMQLWVLALFPIFIVFGFSALKPDYFDPLQTSFTGQMVVGIAALLWLASLFVARKILTVDV